MDQLGLKGELVLLRPPVEGNRTPIASVTAYALVDSDDRGHLETATGVYHLNAENFQLLPYCVDGVPFVFYVGQGTDQKWIHWDFIEDLS